ncbi:MAG: lasso peptide biosynthesis B2 protein [Luteimonas sp.]
MKDGGAPNGAPPFLARMHMTPLSLHDDLSYCNVDGHLIFLDIDSDRYFRLATDLEASFVTLLSGADAPADSLRRLIQWNILVQGSGGLCHLPSQCIEPPMGSAMEHARDAERLTGFSVPGVFSIVLSIQLQLKMRRLKSILAQLVSFRTLQTETLRRHSQTDHDVLATVAAFRRARLFIPIETCCLLDSISLVRFLAKRGVHAHLVFGVTGEPFAAHCWVQHGNVVLNDTVGHVAAHTPIRVI